MARSAKSTTTPAEDGFNPQRLEEAGEAAQQLATLQHGYSHERDLANQMLGQIKMASSFARFADVVSLTKLHQIKETKAYRALAGQRGVDPDGNEIADVGTFDGFCQALGLSRSKVDEDLANLAAFGEEALKSLTSVGVGYRELRQYRRLPDDQKTALIEVARNGDKESFVDLAEEIIAKHAREKESAQVELDTKTALLAKEKLHSERLAKDNDDLHTKLARVKTVKPDQVMKELKQVLSGFALDIEATAVNRLEPAVAALAAHAEANGGDIAPFINSEIGRLETVLRDLRQQFVGASEADVAAWNR